MYRRRARRGSRRPALWSPSPQTFVPSSLSVIKHIYLSHQSCISLNSMTVPMGYQQVYWTSTFLSGKVILATLVMPSYIKLQLDHNRLPNTRQCKGSNNETRRANGLLQLKSLVSGKEPNSILQHVSIGIHTREHCLSDSMLLG